MQENDGQWLKVIGKSLAYLCVQQAAKNDPTELGDIVSKVTFLEGIGLSTAEAAELLGTTANSVKTNQRQREKKGAKRGAKTRK